MKQTDLSRAQSVAISRGLVAPTAARSYSWVEEMDNDSGTNIVEGNVVVVLADGTIQLANTVNEPRPTGVAVDDIDDGESGQVCFGGPVDLVQVVASVTAGTYGQTSTTPGLAQTAPGHATAFCEFTASGTSPSAFLWGGRGGGGLAIASNSGVYIEQLDTAETDTTLFLHPDGTGGVEWTSDASGSETPFDHGNMGSTETVSMANGTWHRGTLNANCTITVSGFTVDEGLVCIFEVTQDGTGGWDITWDPDVLFVGNDQPDQTAGAVTFFLLWSSAGDSTIYGARVGNASSVAALNDLSDVTLTSPATADRLRYNGSAWANSALTWRPVMAFDGTNWLVVVDGSGNAVMAEA